MARTTEQVCLTLRPETVRALNAAAQTERRSRSQVVDLLLERALTGPERLRALEQIAAASIIESSQEIDAVTHSESLKDIGINPQRHREIASRELARQPTPEPLPARSEPRAFQPRPYADGGGRKGRE
ncbi:MAG: hypothetical protein WBE92_09730 [Steroidobacteraceae bacterium]